MRFKYFTARLFLASLLFLGFSASSLFAELTDEQKALIDEYRKVGTADDAVGMDEAWNKIMQDDAIIQHIADNEGHLAAHYYSSTARRKMNKIQQDAAANGEILSMNEIQARAENPVAYEPTGPKAVSGDPELADLADPSRRHVKAVPIDPQYREKMDAAVEARKQSQRAQTQQRMAPAANDLQDVDGPTGPRDGGGAGDRLTKPRPAADADPKLSSAVDEPLMLPAGKEPQKMLPAPDEPLMLPAGKEPQKMLPAGEEPLLLPAKSSAPETLENQSIKKPTPKTVNVEGDVPASGYLESVRRSQTYMKAQDAMNKVGRVKDNAELLGYAADGYRKEAEEAALQGREFSALNAAGKTAYDYSGGQQYDLSRSISEKELEKARKQGYTEEEALLRSMAENVRARVAGGYEASQKINDEAVQAEIERAQAAGEGASLMRAKANAMGTLVSNMSGATQVFDAINYDSDADRQMAETGRALQEKANEKLKEGLLRTGELEQRINDLVENWDLKDPAIQAELEELKAEHERERQQLTSDLERLKKNPSMNLEDPDFKVLSDTASFVSKDPAAEAQEFSGLRAEARKLIAECNFDHVYGVLELIPVHQGRYEIEADLQASVMRENTTTNLFNEAKFQVDSKNPHHALSYLNQALSNTQCEASRVKIQGIIGGVQAEVTAAEAPEESIEELANLDCRSFGPAVSMWNQSRGQAQCVCLEGYELNQAGTACSESRASRLAGASCDHISGSTKQWDTAGENVVCRCPSGYVIDNGQCAKKKVRSQINNAEAKRRKQQMFGQLANSLMQMQQQGKPPVTNYGNADDYLSQVMSRDQYPSQSATVQAALSGGNAYAPTASSSTGQTVAGFTGFNSGGGTAAPSGLTVNQSRGSMNNSGIGVNASRAAGAGSGVQAPTAASTPNPCQAISVSGGGRHSIAKTTCGWKYQGVYYNSHKEAAAARDLAFKNGATYF